MRFVNSSFYFCFILKLILSLYDLPAFFSILLIFLQGNSTPLHIACQNGHFGVVKLLVAAKANTGAQNEVCISLVLHFFSLLFISFPQSTGTALHIACSNGFIGIVKLLLSHQTTGLETKNKVWCDH